MVTNHIRTLALSSVALSMAVFAGCDAGPVEDTVDPAAAGSEAAPISGDGELISQVQSSDATRQGVSLAAWKLMRNPVTNDVTVLGLDFSGSEASRIQIVRAAEVITIAADQGAISIDKNGHVIKNTLNDEQRRLLEHMSTDLKDAGVQYGALACGASVLATIGVAGACGATFGWGCLGVPWVFCNASKHCGNNACGA